MDREEELKQYKKITLRFLKEIGLYKAWINYLNSPEGKDFVCGKWYDKRYIISILGATTFTKYIGKYYGIILQAPIFKYFRTYVELYYPDVFDGEIYDIITGGCKEIVITQYELFSKFPQLKR